MNHTYCRTCKAPIVWVLTKSGKRMPIDHAAVPDGNIVIDGITAHVLKPGVTPPQGVPRYKSHFVTCPQAVDHRRKQ